MRGCRRGYTNTALVEHGTGRERKGPDRGLVVVEKLGAAVEDPVLLVEVDGERRRVVAGAGEEVVDGARPVAARHSGC